MIGLHECSRTSGNGGGSPAAHISVRERTAQAVDYYNNTVLRARVNAGLAAPRASYNDRHQHGAAGTRRHHGDALYRSNSSLELQDHHQHMHQHHQYARTSPPLRREYGSHGSIDVIAADRPTHAAPGTGDSFFAMLQDYRPAVLGVINADQRSPGPSEYLRGKLSQADVSLVDGATCSLPANAPTGGDDERPVSSTPSSAAANSPKLRLKLHRFWGTGSANVRQHPHQDDSPPVSCTGTSSANNTAAAGEIDERARRRAFAHYDCQSLTANLGYAAKLRSLLLAHRRNTTTGASAASQLNQRSATPDGDSGDEDCGDGQSNDLLESCPYFRNEVGGEGERVVSLTRVIGSGDRNRRAIHRPPLSYGVSVLEFPAGETHWRHAICPYQRLPRPVETVDHGALYYRKHFLNNEHQNWFGMDEQLGPVAISIKRERLSNTNENHQSQYQYRLVIRTSELLTLRGSILEEAIPNLKHGNANKTINAKEVLDYVAPEVQLSCLRLGIQAPQTEEQLLKLDEQGLTNHYKVGIMYCKSGQASEEEMYNNEEAGPAFLEFLDCIGQRVRLKGFDKYKAGLDNKTDSTGLYSVYAQHQDCEIMFHVSTMLPFTPNNRQQLLRKRHIGNDIVTIVFQEPGALPFTPRNIRSQFQHVFVIIRVINPCTENTHYSVAVSRSKEVPVFGPPIKDGAVYPKSRTFADFLLAKVINAENAAHRSEKFATMATRTRQEYLKDLATNYTTNAVIDAGQKFSIFSSKKKEKPRPAFIGDCSLRGAICWQVVLDDSGQSALVDCYMGVSTDTVVLIEERTRQIVFVTPCTGILGWSANTNSLRLYHHQGECVTIHMREGGGDRDELLEIMERLRAVTDGHVAQELTLRRNPMGQLGFHVQPDGVVTQVESMGLAWHAGLRQGARLVEICKVAVSTLSHDQMVDLLKTSMLVTVTVIPPLSDNSPRKGCTLHSCKLAAGHVDGDYENLDTARSIDDNSTSPHKKGAQLQQAVPGNHRRRYERSFSPPRSSNSSGYGTGSSSRSFGHEHRYTNNNINEGTITSSSSGHSSDDRWYELLEASDYDKVPNTTPPPLPQRIGNANSTPKRYPDNMTHSASHAQLSQVQTPQHPKIQVSHSLPLPHASFSLPLSNHNHYQSDYEHVDHKMMKGNDRPTPRTANIEYLVTRRPTVGDYSTVEPVRNGFNDGHSTDTSSVSEGRGLGNPSEDELSNGSGNVSPRLRRSQKHRQTGQLTPSGGSRNHSPRPINGETRLRPGVTPRSNRNSANLSSSTLQEDLIRLIDPDYMCEDQPAPNQDNVEPNCTRRDPEVILTLARPATVISNASSASSPAPSEFKSTREDGMSPRVKSIGPEPLPLPDAGEMDWPSLVDTATRAMLHVQDQDGGTTTENSRCVNNRWDPIDVEEALAADASITSTMSTSTSVPELQSHLNELETRVSLETRRRKSLEDEVRRLREENRRLQDESQAAAHQLRRFTEWFFQTIDKQ